MRSIFLREKAIANLLAADARHQRSVVGFRRDILENRLLNPSELPKWFGEQLERQKPYLENESRERQERFKELMVRLQKESILLHDEDSLPPIETLRFVVPQETFQDENTDGRENELEKVVPIVRRGALWRLKRVVRRLVKEYGWSEGYATTFVLTDMVPRHSSGSYLIHFSNKTFLWNIQLTIPFWYSKEDVLRLYNGVRQSVKKASHGVGFPLPISERISELVVFVSKRLGKSGRPGCGWLSTAEEWNARKDIPADWRYKDWRSMATAFNRARKSLLGI